MSNNKTTILLLLLPPPSLGPGGILPPSSSSLGPGGILPPSAPPYLRLMERKKAMKNINSSGVLFKLTHPMRIFDYKAIFKQECDQEEEEEENLEQTAAANNQALLTLPLDMFLNILSRLPIKHLAICRCVCKTWLTLVHHSRFAIMHHTRSTQYQHNYCFKDTTSLVFTFKYSHLKWYPHTLPDFIHFLQHDTNDTIDNALLLHPPYFGPKTIVGSCDGLLCLTDNDSIYIWNPVIGEYAIIPIPYTGGSKQFKLYGFGFDQVDYQYKVVVVDSRRIEFTPKQNPTDKLVGQIYTLGSSEWRMLADVPYSLHQTSSNVFINGSLHWMSEADKGQGLNNSEFIVAFHVGREEFQIVPKPPGMNPTCYGKNLKHTCNQSIWDLGGYLSLFDRSSHGLCNIWIMKEYGVESSWTKEYLISQADVGHFGGVPASISLMRNGNILMVLDKTFLICYDPMEKSFSEIGRIDGPYRLHTITHVGSLLLLQDIIRPANGKQSQSKMVQGLASHSYLISIFNIGQSSL